MVMLGSWDLQHTWEQSMGFVLYILDRDARVSELHEWAALAVKTLAGQEDFFHAHISTGQVFNLQVTQGAGQLLSNFELPWCGEEIAFPEHEEIHGALPPQTLPPCL